MKPFRVISEKEEYRDGTRFSVIRAQLETPQNKEVHWTYIKQNDGVIVIALDETNNIYIKQEWRLNKKDFLWELPSGYIGKEHPTLEIILETGNRELQEEVGVKGKKLALLGSFFTSNHSTNQFHVVLATHLEKSKLTGDEHEHIVAEIVPFEEASVRLLKQQTPTAQVLIAMSFATEYLKKNTSQ